MFVHEADSAFDLNAHRFDPRRKMLCNYGYEAVVAAVVIAAASTAATMYTQSEQTAAQNQYQQKAQDARDKEIQDNYALSIESMHRQQKALQERQKQEGEATVTEEARNARAAAEARATARTAAGEAGVSGLSLDALLTDFTRQESEYRYGVRRNLGISTDQLTNEMEGARAQAQGRSAAIPSLNLEAVNGPSYLGAALRIGGDALGAYSKYNASKPTRPTPNQPTDYYKAGGGEYM
jgi:hypothetical protein